MKIKEIIKKYGLDIFIAALLIFMVVLQARAQTPLIMNTQGREGLSLNGDWRYIVDPYENGFYNYRYEPYEDQEQPWKSAFFLNSKVDSASELLEYNFDKSPLIKVPGDWNSQEEKLYYYEGTVWYKKSFDYMLSEEGNRTFVYFEGVNYKADVYFNGKKVGQHIGGFTPFNFEVTDLLKEKDNFVVVKVDNKRSKDGVPTLNTDWWNYGGITRGVKLIETPMTFIEDYFVFLDSSNNNKISGEVTLNGSIDETTEIKISIPELNVNKIVKFNSGSKFSFSLDSENIQYWSPKNPKLYKVVLTTNEDEVDDQIGFRTIQTEGKDILLNGERIFLKGICIHEENPLREGRAHSVEDSRLLLSWAKDLGCNYVRLAHYPHNEKMVRLADEMGLLVWEENPVYWTISWKNNETFLNAKNQLTEAIHRDKNRASVIIWSMANETPTSSARNSFLTRLANHTRALDPTRLISAALEQKNYNGDPNVRTIDDPFAEIVDVLSFNQYIGWYDGLPDKCTKINWKIVQDKPVLISEFGAGAKQGYYGSPSTRWTEEFQENLYIQTLSMLDRVEGLSGFSPWVLVDFKSPRRLLPEIQDEWNRKGLIGSNGIKKKAFFTLQKYYKEK